MVILAAGMSERMGVCKPLLPVGGESAIMRCIRIAKTAGLSEIIVVTGHYHAEIMDAIDSKREIIRLVCNDKYREGMYTSVCTGVSSLSDNIDGFFVLPVDSCAITRNIPEMLIESFRRTKGINVIRPCYMGRRGHPPLIPSKHSQAMLSYNGENGLKGFLANLPTSIVETDSAGILLDMDTPEDYAKLLEHLGHCTYPPTATCAELLSRYDTPSDIVAHGVQVSEIAIRIAEVMIRKGAQINTSLLESACLLHDICRRDSNHELAGKNLLLREGYPMAAIIVGTHMDIEFNDKNIREAELLYLADKLCRRGKIVPIEDTVSEMEIRYATDPVALTAAKRRLTTAQMIVDTLKTRYDISVENTVSTSDINRH